jgi:hypothetical protein
MAGAAAKRMTARKTNPTFIDLMRSPFGNESAQVNKGIIAEKENTSLKFEACPACLEPVERSKPKVLSLVEGRSAPKGLMFEVAGSGIWLAVCPEARVPGPETGFNCW